MSLRGTINDFGAVQVIQLIASQRKSGRLDLSSGNSQVRLSFKDGEIVNVENLRRPESARLGAMLLAANAVKREDLERALAEQKTSHKALGQILISIGAAPPELVARFLELQRKETLDELFLWTSGEYELDVHPVDPPNGGPGPITGEFLAIQGLRIVTDWPAIKEKLPSFDSKLLRVRDLPHAPAETETDDDAIDLLSANDPAMDPTSEPTTFEQIEPNDRLVFGLVGEGRTIQEIIARSQLGTFEACRSLATLISYGYVAAPRTAPKAAERAPIEDLDHGREQVERLPLRRVFVLTFTAALLAIVIARVPAIIAETRGSASLERYSKAAATRSLTRAIEVYQLEVGVYPATLEELVGAGLVRDRDLVGYTYRRTETGFSLEN